MTSIRFSKLHHHAKPPKRATPGSAGYDLFALESAILRPLAPTLMRTGIAIELPPGYEAQVRPRSGLALKGVWSHVGTIDSDYRGEVHGLLLYVGDVNWIVTQGDKIAQLVIARVECPEWVLVEAGELTRTERGVGGYGSTGR